MGERHENWCYGCDNWNSGECTLECDIEARGVPSMFNQPAPKPMTTLQLRVKMLKVEALIQDKVHLTNLVNLDYTNYLPELDKVTEQIKTLLAELEETANDNK